MSAISRNDVQRENGSGRGPGPRPAIGYATDRPLSTSVPGRGVDVVMDCRRRRPESPVGGPPVVRRRRVRLSAPRCAPRPPHRLCAHRRKHDRHLPESHVTGLRKCNLLRISRVNRSKSTQKHVFWHVFREMLGLDELPAQVRGQNLHLRQNLHLY